ncbi:tripartite tricarboxylate transporter substrate binding protein [Cupriavidus plantarum]|uniref:Tripartite-type tricarboxylate transporter receptor subunit TctC n=1 Tax=Cupriavidus plantarum TaxID=942865 RepID=A0A316EZT6_9BURK|nr:tripartite tricarboxylate transporter substrate binding protein [Cupriavidus plantarum]PWK37395.1 tripartite-type tricarboxylate transporter receptor subunit TctC [Cupriavidus plantarum]
MNNNSSCNTIRNRIGAAIASAMLVLAPAVGHADTYPSKPVRLIVPFPPGGSVDYVARTISQKLSENLGQTVVVDNRGGASGTIGTAEAARAAPDGYTLLLVFDSHAVNQSLYDIKYDTFKSFDYVSLIGTMPMAVVTSKKSGLTSLQALLSKARANPGGVTYGSSGVGGSNHLNPVAFAKKAGINLMHVPYRGGGPMLTALLGGEVDMVISSLPTVVNYEKTGRANIVAIASKEPAPQLPGVPTVDSVLPGYVAQSWVGMVAPAQLPKDVFQKVQGALSKTLADPDIRTKMANDGFHIVGSSPAAFEQQVRQEARRWGDLIREENIRVE